MKRKVAITLCVVAAAALAAGTGWKWDRAHHPRQGTRIAGWTWDEGTPDQAADPVFDDGWTWDE